MAGFPASASSPFQESGAIDNIPFDTLRVQTEAALSLMTELCLQS